MLSKVVRSSVWLSSFVFAGLCLSTFSSAQQMGDAKAQSVTGCLQKGDEAGGFVLAGEDGKVWELHGKKVPLANHVGHTVTVTGSPASRSKAEEEKIEADEKKEAAGKEHGDLRVETLKMVSDSCK